MTKSKGWNWSIIKGSHADFWRTPSIESFYLVNRWQGLEFKDFLGRIWCVFGGFAHKPILPARSNLDSSDQPERCLKTNHPMI